MNQLRIHDYRVRGSIAETRPGEYLTVFVAGAFALTVLTGIIRYFDVFSEELDSLHICLGGLLIFGVVGQVLWYWPRVVRAFSFPAGKAMVLALLFLAVVPWLVGSSEDSGHRSTREVLSKAACQASVSALVSVADISPGSVLERLQDQGMTFESWQQTPEEIAMQNGREAMEVVAIIFEQPSENRST